MHFTYYRSAHRGRGQSDRRTEVQRALKDLSDHIKKAVSITANSSLSHLHVLHAVYLLSTRHQREVYF